MRDFCFKLFADSYFNTGISITAFSVPHIVYLILIAGGIFLAGYSFKGKDMQAKDKTMRFLAYALVSLYIFDFFTHEFVYDGMNIDKLPFHLCTLMCPMVAFTQFNKKFEKIIEPITALAIVGPLMYLCYPANIGTGEPWCYQAVQTMLFHGVELAWGILNLVSGKVRLQMKNIWKAGVGLCLLTLWAKLGNLMFEKNWFFLEEDALYIGLVADGVIPKWSLMIFTPVAVFLIVLAVYGIYYGVKAWMEKRAESVSLPQGLLAEVAVTQESLEENRTQEKTE